MGEPQNPQKKRVDFYYWPDCGSHGQALGRLRAAIQALGAEDLVEIEEHVVATEEEAEFLRFPGSPTIRIDGVDIDPAGAEGLYCLTCRAYANPDTGGISPIPSEKLIEEALRKALGR